MGDEPVGVRGKSNKVLWGDLRHSALPEEPTFPEFFDHN